MTAAKYGDEILLGVMLSFQQAHPVENIILVNDDTISRCARVIKA